MKPLAVVLLLLTGCAHAPQRPTPSDTVVAGTDIPAKIYAAFEKGESIDLIGTPVAIVGSLGRIGSKPHINIDGEEWAVEIVVKKVLLGPTWNGQKSLWFGVSNPSNLPLEPNRDYYVVAAGGRHGTLLLEIVPVAEAPNPSPPPPSGLAPGRG